MQAVPNLACMKLEFVVVRTTDETLQQNGFLNLGALLQPGD